MLTLMLTALCTYDSVAGWCSGNVCYVVARGGRRGHNTWYGIVALQKQCELIFISTDRVHTTLSLVLAESARDR